MEKQVFYRLSTHPHVVFTTLEKVKTEALEYLEYMGFEEDSEECIAVSTWDGKDELFLEGVQPEFYGEDSGETQFSLSHYSLV
jgi:hypothetical protein